MTVTHASLSLSLCTRRLASRVPPTPPPRMTMRCATDFLLSMETPKGGPNPAQSPFGTSVGLSDHEPAESGLREDPDHLVVGLSHPRRNVLVRSRIARKHLYRLAHIDALHPTNQF